MLQNKIIEKIIISVLVLSLIMFIGGNIVRYAVAYDIFIPGTALKLKDWYSEAIRVNTVHLFAVISFYTITGFIVAFVSSLLLFLIRIKDLKRYGWLFMAFILFFLASVVEFYLIYNDIHLIMAMNTHQIHSFTNLDIQNYFMFRLKKLTIPSALAFLSIITSIILVIWQPLNKFENNTDKEINNKLIENEK